MSERDVDLVAALHVASWRSAYRGLMSDAYLDERAPADRRAHWAGRLADVSHMQAGIIAERGGAPAGFAFLVGNADPARGTLLDNLHVRPGLRGGGIGRLLLSEAARELTARGWQRRLHLWVFAENSGARRFYERHGAMAVEHAPFQTSDGTTHPAVCYVWNDAASLV